MKKRITEIEIECRETFVIALPSAAGRPACAKCGGAMILPAEAAALARLGLRAIFRMVEADSIHFADEETNGVFYVCASSLAPEKLNISSVVSEEKL